MDNYSQFQSVMKDKIGKYVMKKGRFYFDVENKNIIEVAEYLFRNIGCRLSTATGQETLNGIEVLYHFSDDKTGSYYCPRVIMNDKQNPVMNSISPVVKGAEWIEREIAEMLGVKFTSHPNPEPLLTGNHPNNLTKAYRHRRNNG